LTNLGKRSWCM